MPHSPSLYSAGLACSVPDRSSSSLKTEERRNHVQMVLFWLEDNFEVNLESCLPRCSLYMHYLDMSRRNAHAPMGAATFGKLIRQKFPMLTTRRLGTRGQSKYHYLGLGIKNTSIYNPKKHSGKGLTRFSLPGEKGQLKSESGSKAKTKTLLGGFPRIKSAYSKKLSEVELFLVVYKAHCQRILDTIVGANFDEVESFLLHFWHGMPDHISKSLDADAMPEVVAACDTIFYKKLIDILIPSSITEIPYSINSEIINFAKNFVPWLDMCLINAPKSLTDTKMDVARTYVKIIQRHLSFLQLAQAARGILSDGNLTAEIISHLESTDFESILATIGCCFDNKHDIVKKNFYQYLKEVLHLLGRHATIEAFTCLLDKIVFDLLQESKQQAPTTSKLNSTEFVLYWSQFISKFTEDLTLRNVANFGSIHLLTVTAMEYIFLIIESEVTKRKEIAIWEKIRPYSFVDKDLNSSDTDTSQAGQGGKAKNFQGDNRARREYGELNRASIGEAINDYHMRIAYNTLIPKNDAANQYDAQNAFTNISIDASNCSKLEEENQKENAAYWMRNLPSLQDLVTNGSWNESEHGKLQTFDNLMAWHNENENAISYAYNDPSFHDIGENGVHFHKF